MCGIVGYIVNEKAQQILVSGLKRLEYRGYDSAGIVTVSIGHCHPEVVAAVNRQNQLLQHTTTIYLNNEIAEYAKELADKMPGNLKVGYQVLMVCTCFCSPDFDDEMCCGLIKWGECMFFQQLLGYSALISTNVIAFSKISVPTQYLDGDEW